MQLPPRRHLPPALLPLRHPVFRMLWTANTVVALGTWLQNTGAGWLMTLLAPDPLIVSLVQLATLLPVLLLALPAGALADIVDRRLFLIATQTWTFAAAAVLAGMTLAGVTSAASLLILTFAIGIGSAMTQPCWGAVVPELVPRRDLVQAIALNGIGFNLARAVGPALAGLLVLLGGPGLAFTLNAVSFVAVLAALIVWRRRVRTDTLPREHLVSAMRAGMRFVRNTPAMQTAMLRSFAYFFSAAAPWAMLPLVVRVQLGQGPGMYGVILGLMGVGGVTSGMLLPRARALAGRGALVVVSTLVSCAGIALLGVSGHWAVAALGMALFGLGWVAAASTLQAAAQLAAPPWVRARALGIYQLAFNGGLALGTFFWGWLGSMIGLPDALYAAAALGVVGAVAVRRFGIDGEAREAGPRLAPAPVPEAPAAELAQQLPRARGQVLETMLYEVSRAERDSFLAVMTEVRRVRGRAGAISWQLYEDVAHPEGWLEIWSMENWTDHLREATRLSEEDRGALARAAAYHGKTGAPLPSRYIGVEPPHRAGG